MNSSEIMKALEIVLMDREFQIIVSESDSLLCERGGTHYRIRILGDDSEPLFPAGGENEVRVIVASEEMADEMAERILNEGILVWPLEDLEREVGRIAMATHGIEAETSSTFLDRLLSGGGPLIEREPRVSAFVSPVITEEMARSISEETVKGFNFNMEYVPHFIYTYSMLMRDKEGEERRKEGEIWMNGVSGDFIAPLDESELVPREDMETGEMVEPEIDSDDALEMAKEWVLGIREEEKEAVTEVPGAMAINRKTFLPVEDTLNLSFRGTVYLPVWLIEGIRGSIIIDAVKGELINEIFFEDERAADEGDDGILPENRD